MYISNLLGMGGMRNAKLSTQAQLIVFFGLLRSTCRKKNSIQLEDLVNFDVFAGERSIEQAFSASPKQLRREISWMIAFHLR